MGAEKTYVSLDEQDLEALITAYANKFYGIITEVQDEDLAGCEELREIVKKLAGFVKEYEAVIKKKQASNGEVALGA